MTRWADRPTFPASSSLLAGGDYPAVLRELGSHRPPVVLSATQTYLAHEGYEAYGMVRLWTGRGFSNLRLRPEDLDHAVGIVTQYSHIPILVQLASNGRTLYVDIQSRRAFSSFKDWVDYGRAQERIWRRSGFSLSHNVAHLPFG